MKAAAGMILPFPSALNSGSRRALEKELMTAVRASESPIIVDLSGRQTLNHGDIDTLLDCVGVVAGRDTQLMVVAGSPGMRALLEVTRIATLVPVFDSLQEAVGNPNNPAQNGVDGRTASSQQSWSA